MAARPGRYTGGWASGEFAVTRRAEAGKVGVDYSKTLRLLKLFGLTSPDTTAAPHLFLEGGGVAVAGEGVLAAVMERLLPVADKVVADAEGACSLGDGVALLGDELDGLGFELRGVTASRSRH
jgi:hypothetical protein